MKTLLMKMIIYVVCLVALSSYAGQSIDASSADFSFPDALPYAKPDINYREYALIENSVLVYEFSGSGVLSLPDCNDSPFRSLLLITAIGDNGTPELPYRFILRIPRGHTNIIPEEDVVVEKICGILTHECAAEDQNLAMRLLWSDAYLSDDGKIMGVLDRIKRPLRNLLGAR